MFVEVRVHPLPPLVQVSFDSTGWKNDAFVNAIFQTTDELSVQHWETSTGEFFCDQFSRNAAIMYLEKRLTKNLSPRTGLGSIDRRVAVPGECNQKP